MLLVGTRKRGGGAVGGGRGRWGGRTNSINLVKGLPKMTGNAHQRHLACPVTQVLQDAKHDSSLVLQCLTLVSHDKQ